MRHTFDVASRAVYLQGRQLAALIQADMGCCASLEPKAIPNVSLFAVAKAQKHITLNPHLMLQRMRRYAVRIWRDMPILIERLGLSGAVGFAFYSPVRELLATPLPSVYRIPLPRGGHAHLRPGSSDRMVFEQIFVNAEYLPILKQGEIRTILDLGANCGFASLWFLREFPDARIIAVEPLAANVAAFERNLAPFRERVEVHQKAVWNREGSVGFAPSDAAWAGKVSDSTSADVLVDAITMQQLFDLLPEGRSDLVKMDIEGAEIELLSEADWVDRLACLVVELHGPQALALARAHFAEPAWDAEFSGEVHIFTRVARS